MRRSRLKQPGPGAPFLGLAKSIYYVRRLNQGYPLNFLYRCLKLSIDSARILSWKFTPKSKMCKLCRDQSSVNASLR